MGLALSDILQSVDNNLKFRDLTVLPLGDKEDAIAEAVLLYSRRRPIRRVTALTGTASGLYELPPYFEDDFSSINEIEYPINSTPKTVIDERNYYLDDTVDGRRIRFDFGNPATGDVFWLKYTSRHTITSAGETSIPSVDRDVFGYLATAVICRQLATFYASKANPSLASAEIVEYRTRTQEWSGLAETWMKAYEKYAIQDTTGVYGSLPWQQTPYWDRRKD